GRAAGFFRDGSRTESEGPARRSTRGAPWPSDRSGWRSDGPLPDGNATIARLLVRWLIPDAVPGSSMEDVGAAHVNYAALDRSSQTARIRLNSTVVHVAHQGDPSKATEIVTSYVRGGKTYQVRSRAVVMACWNMFIPYLVPDLPAAQKEALAFGVKGPLVYTSVA